jgi:hypothetical protein
MHFLCFFIKNLEFSESWGFRVSASHGIPSHSRILEIPGLCFSRDPLTFPDLGDSGSLLLMGSPHIPGSRDSGSLLLTGSPHIPGSWRFRVFASHGIPSHSRILEIPGLCFSRDPLTFPDLGDFGSLLLKGFPHRTITQVSQGKLDVLASHGIPSHSRILEISGRRFSRVSLTEQ